ncbi:MAG TPA: hypothetical protein VFB02_04680 [Bradyrhizobium sp.]|nr:hypothetical protein [Bradyrhizobium sp.]
MKPTVNSPAGAGGKANSSSVTLSATGKTALTLAQNAKQAPDMDMDSSPPRQISQSPDIATVTPAADILAAICEAWAEWMMLPTSSANISKYAEMRPELFDIRANIA